MLGKLGKEKIDWWDFLPRVLPSPLRAVRELSASSTARFFFFLPPHNVHHCHAAQLLQVSAG